MYLRRAILILAVIMLVLGAETAFCAKPTSKPRLGSIGTSQLPGPWCKYGQSYTLGKTDKMNVTLKSAEYSLGHVLVGERNFWAKEGEKLLVVHFSLHNPLPREQHVQYNTIDFTAVDSKSENKNEEYLGVGIEGSHKLLDQEMKPAQKIELYAVIRVAGDGEVPKLMVAYYEVPAPVARYDLRADQKEHPQNKVKPLDPPYADPSDKTGATVAKKIPGVLGTTYMTGSFDAKVEKIEFITPPIADESFTQGNVYVAATVECKFFGDSAPAGVTGSDSFTSGMKLEDADGVGYERENYFLTASSNRFFDPSIGKDAPGKFRVVFSVPKGVQLKTLTLKEYDGYPVLIDVSAYKTP